MNRLFKVVDNFVDLNNRSFYIGSQKWYQWLETIKSFNYEPPQLTGYTYVRHNITVRKRSNGKFYAIRTVNCRQRVRYLGSPSDLDYERLQNAVDELSIDDYLYYRLKSNKSRIKI
ncbi:MAG: hypothetical protein IGS23_13995 [Rivularia sp. T60_A2020_040]|nr:hypothetical protein [Rivularia sp. T60_A2020_040]